MHQTAKESAWAMPCWSGSPSVSSLSLAAERTPPCTSGRGWRASTHHQEEFIGNQSGGRVFLFLRTDDFWRDYERFRQRGVEFVRDPKVADYGTVAVFKDLYGTLWDLIEFSDT